MTKLDVLLIEGFPGEGAADAARLETAGHRVHRCWDAPVACGEPDRVHLRDRYLCNGVIRRSCPLDRHVDVALLVRSGVRSEPTVRETAVTCALRAGVPVVEDGPSILDPYAPWVARAGDDVEATCEAAAQRAFDPLRAEIAVRLRPLLDAARVAPEDVQVVIEVDPQGLGVRLQGPVVGSGVEEALCVRALDAVRTLSRRFARVDVSYDAILS